MLEPGSSTERRNCRHVGRCQIGYVASIVSRRIGATGLMWDLDNTPLSGRAPFRARIARPRPGCAGPWRAGQVAGFRSSPCTGRVRCFTGRTGAAGWRGGPVVRVTGAGSPGPPRWPGGPGRMPRGLAGLVMPGGLGVLVVCCPAGRVRNYRGGSGLRGGSGTPWGPGSTPGAISTRLSAGRWGGRGTGAAGESRGGEGSRGSRARRPLRGRGRAEAAAGGSRGPVIPGGPDLPPLPDRRPGPVCRGLRARSRG